MAGCWSPAARIRPPWCGTGPRSARGRRPRAGGRTTSAEVRQRIRRVLDAGRDVDPSPDRLRELRVVEVLEALAARERLAELARGAAGAFLTREAEAALRRLERRAG